MQTAIQFDQTFEQRLARVDLTKVMRHVQTDTGMSDADLVRAEDLYRKFLTLKAKYANESIVPVALVDHVWHAHITFTRQYMADCELLFGRFLHHDVIDANADADWKAQHHRFAATQQLFEDEFGMSLSAVLSPAEQRITLCYGD